MTGVIDPAKPRMLVTKAHHLPQTDYILEMSKFNGTIHWVHLDLGTEDAEHLILPEERWRAVTTRQ